MQAERRVATTGVRIIGGRWRGRRLTIPAGTGVRPTPDRVRETLFNWLQPALAGARCLDLFAGTGVLGLEALSRGAAETWFVERNASLLQRLQEHCEKIGAEARTVRDDALKLLSTSPPRPFDIVFADPPYEMGLAEVLSGLGAWLAADHRIYVERPAARRGQTLEELLAAMPGVRVLKSSRAGRVAFGLIRLTASE